MTEHPDLEALSAYVDGEAPDEAAHVAGCASCRATVDGLRAVSVAVGAPVSPPTAGQRETAVAAAITAGLEAGARQDARERRRRSPGSWLAPVAALAAAILVTLGVTVMIDKSGRSPHDDQTALAGRAPETGPTIGAGPGAGSGSSAGATATDSAAGAPPPDLGEIPDPATLSARSRAALAAVPTATVAAPAPAPAPAPGARLALPAPAVVGTRPCEEQARLRQPSLGPVVFFATARRGGVPAVVLGFSTGADPAPGSNPPVVSLQLLAQDGCAELLRAAGP